MFSHVQKSKNNKNITAFKSILVNRKEEMQTKKKRLHAYLNFAITRYRALLTKAMLKTIEWLETEDMINLDADDNKSHEVQILIQEDLPIGNSIADWFKFICEDEDYKVIDVKLNFIYIKKY